MIPLRRSSAVNHWHFSIWHMALAGAVIGFLTGMVLSAGPLSVPISQTYEALIDVVLAVGALTMVLTIIR